MEPYFAYTIVEKDPSGMITGRLLQACPSLEAVCQWLKRWNFQPRHVHVTGWTQDGQEWGVRTDRIEQAMLQMRGNSVPEGEALSLRKP